MTTPLFVPLETEAQKRLRKLREKRKQQAFQLQDEQAESTFQPPVPTQSPIFRLSPEAVAFQERGETGRLTPEQQRALRDFAPVDDLTRLGLTESSARGPGISPFQAFSNIERAYYGGLLNTAQKVIPGDQSFERGVRERQERGEARVTALGEAYEEAEAPFGVKGAFEVLADPTNVFLGQPGLGTAKFVGRQVGRLAREGGEAALRTGLRSAERVRPARAAFAAGKEAGEGLSDAAGDVGRNVPGAPNVGRSSLAPADDAARAASSEPSGLTSLAGEDAAPPRGEAFAREPEELVKDLTRRIREAKPAREITEQEVSRELGRRAAIARSNLASGNRIGARGAFSGELPKTTDIEPVAGAFTTEEGAALRQMIVSKFQDSPFKWIQADTAFNKLFDEGQIPTRSELTVLEEVFGKEFVRSILDMRGSGRKAWEIFLEAWNIPRAFKASGDLSAALNQAGLLMFEGNTKPWRESVVASVKAFAREDAARSVYDSIASSPWYEASQRAGLDLTTPSFIESAGIAAREEPFIGARLARKIPIAGKLVELSERGYVTMLNKMRFDIFSREAAKLGPGATQKDLKEIANTINIATGRGNLGKFNESSAILNGIFFAPRFATSRFQVPGRLVIGNPTSRKLAARSLVSYTTTVMTWLTLLDLAGVGDVEWDPRSSDFLKLQIKNTRIDPWMGLQQPAVLVARVLSGQTKTATTNNVRQQDPTDTIKMFFESKLHPTLQALNALRKGEVFGGDELLGMSPASLENPTNVGPRTVGVPNIVYETFTPLFIQDIIEAGKDLGWGSVIVAPYTFFGGRVQTFGNEGTPEPVRQPREQRPATSPTTDTRKRERVPTR